MDVTCLCFFQQRGKELFFSFFCFFVGVWLGFLVSFLFSEAYDHRPEVSLLSSVLYRPQGSRELPASPLFGFQGSHKRQKAGVAVSVFWIVLGRRPIYLCQRLP